MIGRLSASASEIPAQKSDEELFGAFLDGDQQSFVRLHQRYQKPLVGYLRKYLGSEADAEDVFQDTMIKVFNNRESFERGARVSPWIYTIATRQAIDSKRRKGRHPMLSLHDAHTGSTSNHASEKSLQDLLADPLPTPPEAAIAEEKYATVRTSLDGLKTKHQEVLRLAFMDGMPYGEISDVLHIPIGTVKSRINQALTVLRKTPAIQSTSLA